MFSLRKPTGFLVNYGLISAWPFPSCNKSCCIYLGFWPLSPLPFSSTGSYFMVTWWTTDEPRTFYRSSDAIIYVEILKFVNVMFISQELPKHKKRPVYCLAMKGVKVCCTSIDRSIRVNNYFGLQFLLWISLLEICVLKLMNPSIM